MGKWQFGIVAVLFSLHMLDGHAQEKDIFDIPFSTDKRLLVFKGKLNGVETDFAFDTGAAEGIASTKDEKRGGVTRVNRTQRIIDGNGKTAEFQTVFTNELSIGGFTFKKVRASIHDMQYLYCMDLYLLGADVIRQLNWEIDFTRMVLRVSKNSFSVTGDMSVISVSYQYNTPRTKLRLNGVKFDDVLIDIGYTGSMTIPSSHKRIQELLELKQAQGLVNLQMSSSFAAAGMSKPALVQNITIDSLMMDTYTYTDVEADFKANTDFKIGLGFFLATCEKLIINNKEKKYYLLPKQKQVAKKRFPISVLLAAGKLTISSLLVSDSLANKTFAINQEIQSINGRSAKDFESECDFLTWFYLNKWDTYRIQKLDGTTIDVMRTPVH